MSSNQSNIKVYYYNDEKQLLERFFLDIRAQGCSPFYDPMELTKKENRELDVTWIIGYVYVYGV